jgi:hypothetical protein
MEDLQVDEFTAFVLHFCGCDCGVVWLCVGGFSCARSKGELALYTDWSLR